MRMQNLGNAFKYAFVISAGVASAGALAWGGVKAAKAGAFKAILNRGGNAEADSLKGMLDEDPDEAPED